VEVIIYLHNNFKKTYTHRGNEMADENEGGPDRTHAARAVRALRSGTNPVWARDKTGSQQLATIAAAMSPNTNYTPHSIYTQLRTKLFSMVYSQPKRMPYLTALFKRMRRCVAAGMIRLAVIQSRKWVICG